MKISLNIANEEELRKEIREVIIGEVKHVARNESAEIYKKECERTMSAAVERALSGWNAQDRVMNGLSHAAQVIGERMTREAHDLVWNEFKEKVKIDWDRMIEVCTNRVFQNIDAYVDSRVQKVLAERFK